ncbi:hypothetical protein BZA77DRAFT_362083 [Pyronema omphalodes]|nr:hypothetical protein BZA77DRAFT_362083 [Pyronema omphalodes]
MCTVALIFTFILEWEDANFTPLLFLKFIKKWKHTVQAKKHEKNATSDSEEKRLPKPAPHKLMLRVIWGLYLLVWIWNQFLPLYLLWRIRWMRHNIGSAVNDYIAYTAQIENRRIRVNAGEFEKWDDDKWTFGQVLSMTLWFPALLEMFYSMIAGDEAALTGTLPTPWKATKISPTESTFPVPGQSEATETVASV